MGSLGQLTKEQITPDLVGKVLYCYDSHNGKAFSIVVQKIIMEDDSCGGGQKRISIYSQTGSIWNYQNLYFTESAARLGFEYDNIENIKHEILMKAKKLKAHREKYNEIKRMVLIEGLAGLDDNK